MAHIGKPGPVYFRRDFNINVFNNTSGWYKRTLATFFQLPPGSANTVNGVRWDCGPGQQADFKTINWVSALLATPVFQFQVKLIAQINDGLRFFKGAELIQKNAGTIYAGHWPTNVDLRFPHFDSTVPLILDFYNTEWFDAEPTSVFVECRGKRWDDGPPH